MMGGAWFDKMFGTNPSMSELDSIALKHLKSILNLKEDPISKIVKIHRKCIAQYTVGHKQRVQHARYGFKYFNSKVTRIFNKKIGKFWEEKSLKN